MSAALPTLAPGSVWLVGAGPGDPGLLTLLGAHALAEADIVLHDMLVDPAILALAAPGARLIPVGRRKGRVTASFEHTIALMLRHAAAGHKVVRLKGGDPFVFGRGGEEIAALAASGVPFRVVPGVTAGIGGLAYAGISATRRGINGAVTLITARDEAGGLPDDVDWGRLAREDQNLIVYMGLSVLDEIVEALLAHGRDHRTPVAIVSNATTAAQRMLATTLGESVLAARREKLAAPALIAIGRIADPINIHQWFDPAQSAQAALPRGIERDRARG